MAAVEPIVRVAEAQAFARIETGEEEAVVAGLIRSASALCEAFLRQVVIERPFTESLGASTEWQRLRTAPVRSLTQASSGSVALPAGSFATDIDAAGCGWFRMVDATVNAPVLVSGTAGIAASENDVPEPIRQGVIRLVAHLFAARDGDDAAIPAAVSALWRPYRRMVLA